ncbi:MAG: hypothetical protein SGJ01_09370 [Gemmatimonadota bacterium]|nr:hypothetical protein [Gemmatimonadota bacterium]
MRHQLVQRSMLAGALLLTACGGSAGKSVEDPVIASMKTDLAALLAAQDSFRLTNGDYAGSITPLGSVGEKGGSGRLHFAPIGDDILVLTYVDTAGWYARMDNPAVTGTPSHCGVFEGAPANAPNAAVIAARSVVCW